MFRAPSNNGLPGGVPDAATIEILFQRVVAGTYLVRVHVDGAESILTPDGSGQFATPRVVLP